MATDTKSLEIMRKFSEQYAKRCARRGRAAAHATVAALPPTHACTRVHNRTGTYFCVDKSVTAVVIKGLAEHKDELGAPLCPCRHYDDKAAEAAQGFWNCPCVPMRERKVRARGWRVGGAGAHQSGVVVVGNRHSAHRLRAPPLTHTHVRQECHCMLFLTEDNDFRGEDQSITLDEVVEMTKGM